MTRKESDKLTNQELAEIKKKLAKHEAASAESSAKDTASGIVGLVVICGLIYWFFFSGSSETPEEAAARSQVEQAQTELAQAEEAEKKRKGFHCLSAWDGSHANFKRDIEDRMRDPGSFEHISTSVTPVSSSGTHKVFMEYRAKNGFGGMNIGTAMGTFRNSDCSHIVISLE
ncbi:MAG: hypothetical protein RID11_12890 [Roseovarius sp.]|jgi:hypothetical protein|uniref:hypothetical protein n=1 Tax=Roseovarius sp. TaxID=1486281 RepID=UPI0032EE9686